MKDERRRRRRWRAEKNRVRRKMRKGRREGGKGKDKGRREKEAGGGGEPTTRRWSPPVSRPLFLLSFFNCYYCHKSGEHRIM
ncbi:Os03g0860050 [Oryza sativa Japonica Group]|jgi:hypothetical protein|uniref:Os03g0860050 protein n=1 Tax=Oryza sativa subsp. japonica TaxID=39947 RepID=A0A0P0W5X7_ORYSJ|nr:hypothetical protein EE612_021792 [Oryza sativa]BAS87482.1 Os03g0860050 [Oryza sativa Japonica Group]